MVERKDRLTRFGFAYLDNAGNVEALRLFLLLYIGVVNYFIEFFWSSKNFTAALD